MATTLSTLDLQLIGERLATLEAVPASLDLHDSEERDENGSVASDDSEMEPFEDYKPKIVELLHNIGLANFSVSDLQHGYEFQNCVYALTSSTDPTEKYILRVPVLAELDDGGVCQDIENDVALLRYLSDKLPVPVVKAYSSMSDNVLEKPYSIQTRLPGISLEKVYADLTYEEKLNIIDQLVQLLAKVESIRFSAAGTLSATSSSFAVESPMSSFSEGDEELMQDPSVAQYGTGADVKFWLQSHINHWIQKELELDKSFTLSSLRFLTSMINELDQEGAFKASPHPIVLHHWDLEDRNIMVEKIAGTWKIQGIIDWDAALALPRPLTRRAPDWLWDSDFEGFTGYLDNDHHPKPDTELSVHDAGLKAYFDAKAAETLEGYLDDAYGHGMWLRRIWTFANEGLDSMWYLDLVKKLEEDWNARPVPECLTSSSLVGVLARVIRWVSGLI
ncbi:MAG: hypothetical protein Q9211_004304 [Gyalolechia sp. 1 TL-2023]